MFVQCLGSGDAFGSGGRLNTSFYIRSKSQGILLDCGASTLIALKRENLSTDDVDVIVITHLHGDHFGGLAFILCEILALRRRTKPLSIIGPADTQNRTLQSLECFYPGFDIKPTDEIKFIHYETNETYEAGGIRLTPYRAIHSPATNPHALRLEIENSVIAFSGDTEWTDDLLKASEGADLFMCEASGYQSPLKHHLTIREILDVQGRIHAKKLVLTHAGEEVLNHRNEIPLHLVNDGEILLDD